MFSFYKKNIPYSDNDACKGIKLNKEKSKERRKSGNVSN